MIDLRVSDQLLDFGIDLDLDLDPEWIFRFSDMER